MAQRNVWNKPHTLLVCGTEITASKAPTVEERQAEYSHMSKVYGNLAVQSYQNPVLCRDNAARAYAYLCAAKLGL